MGANPSRPRATHRTAQPAPAAHELPVSYAVGTDRAQRIATSTASSHRRGGATVAVTIRRGRPAVADPPEGGSARSPASGSVQVYRWVVQCSGDRGVLGLRV